MKYKLKKCIGLILAVVQILILLPSTAYAAYSYEYKGTTSAGTARYTNQADFWAADTFAFTPSTTGYYTFYSYNTSAGDPYFYLTSSGSYGTVVNSLANYGYQNATAQNNCLASNDDGGGGRNFSATYLCYSGVTYYCILTKYRKETTTYSFNISGPNYNYVTLNKNGGSGGSSYYYNYNNDTWRYSNDRSTSSSILIPSRSYYYFNGYYNATSGGTQYIDSSGTFNSNGRNCSGTLYAQWSGYNYTMTLNQQSGSGGAANTTLTYGSMIPYSVTPPSRTGYHFGGYYTGMNGGGTQYYNASGVRSYSGTWTTAGGTTLYASWIPNSYTVTFDRQSGSGGSSSSSVTYGSMPMPITVPTRSQYAFMGYFTGTSGSGIKYYDYRGAGAAAYNDSGNRTLYAQWVQNQWNLSFNRQGGTGGTSSTITTGADGTLPSIIPPTRPYYGFRGYYDNTSGTGTQYYDSVGTPISGRKLKTNSVLYAYWVQNQWNISFSTQGGTGGTSSIYTTGTNGTLPTITVPVKEGYVFDGYWSAISGGTQYYDTKGAAIAGKTLTSTTTLYARWKENSYSITYELDGGSITGEPTTRLYSKAAVIPRPTKADHVFMGWQVNNGVDRPVDYTVPANTLSNTALKATWAKSADAEVTIGGSVAVASGNEDTLKEDLSKSFDTIVTEEDKGITLDDLNGNSVKLVLSVDINNNPENEASISALAQGSALTFYDISAEKQVTAAGGVTTTTQLKEIPEPVTVKIPLSGTLAGKSSYAVYRVHDGISERLPIGPVSGEYYEVDGSNIVIHTRKFSTYGVIGSELVLNGKPGEGLPAGGNGMDVQGRVLEPKPGLVYKVDISWGAMIFEYSMDQEWDPDLHMYSEGAFNSWRPTGFDGVNNRIRAINHSNGGVKLNLAITENKLAGVDMALYLFNTPTSEAADSFLLPEAPEGSRDVDLVPAVAYLFLNGSPESDWIDSNKTETYNKAGIITVTVEPHF